MLFELLFIKKYLSLKKKQLSVSLVGLLSVAVITLVVWLVILFLSITEGIEKNWLHKLTSLNAPLRLKPTEEYFSSYYYSIDRYSAASSYLSKTIGQKAQALLTDPYDPTFDEELPYALNQSLASSKGNPQDIVKETIHTLQELQKSIPQLKYQDMEMSGALLRLDLIRTQDQTGIETQSHLTNVSYLTSFPDHNPKLKELLLPPTEADLTHLLFLAKRAGNQGKYQSLLAHSNISQVKPKGSLWKIPFHLLPSGSSFQVQEYGQNQEIFHLIFPTTSLATSDTLMEKRENQIVLKKDNQKEIILDPATPLFAYGPMAFEVKEVFPQGELYIQTTLQNQPISGLIPLEGLEISKASIKIDYATAPTTSLPWPYFANHQFQMEKEGDFGILLAKNFRENGVKIGDAGYLAYSAFSFSGGKEQRIPIYVAGFYDPGIMAVGGKCILVPQAVTETINASENSFTLEKSESNQIFVWIPDLNEIEKVKQALLEKLSNKNLSKYWTVQTFKEYEFAKDIMQQFESDKYLFSLIGILILLVACTNIISLLILLVSDKKKEIGILLAMGAKRRSIAAIFALTGASIGLFSCLLGLGLAFLTLKNIDILIYALSWLQGYPAFNSQFFGNFLPCAISERALLFAAIATPLIALIAGLFPAIKAARLSPCKTLRSE